MAASQATMNKYLALLTALASARNCSSDASPRARNSCTALRISAASWRSRSGFTSAMQHLGQVATRHDLIVPVCGAPPLHALAPRGVILRDKHESARGMVPKRQGCGVEQPHIHAKRDEP